MNDKLITPSTIGSKTFRIPLYQRPYAWEEPQVIQLLNDLHETFTKTPGADYHIGILSVARTSDDKDRDDLIDGQQRITTLMLIGKAARIYWSGWDSFLARDRLHLYGRKGDQDYLDHGIETECNPKMVTTVHLAREFFAKHGTAAFSQHIYEHAAFLIAEVPPGYSPMDKNQQFVRMNNRGKQLEKHEILKVQLLSSVEPTKRKDAFEVWNDMVDCLTGLGDEKSDELQSLASILESNGNIKEPDGGETFYTSIVTIPEFLLIALARACRSSGGDAVCFNTDKLLETFSILNGNADAIDAFMVVLRKQVAILREFFIFVSRGEGYELGMMAKNEEASNGTNRLIAVQSFLHVSTEPHHWLIPAFDWCSQFLGGKFDWEQFVTELEEIDNALIREGVRNLYSINDIYDMKYGNVNHYWFYRLDYELWKLWDAAQSSDSVWAELPNEAKHLVSNFRFRSCGSVEHINPQHPMEGNKSGEEPDHSFGNLALISSSRNAKFNNLPADGKKEIIRRSYAESLKMLHFLWCNPDAHSEGKLMHEILFTAALNRKSPPVREGRE